MSLEDFKESLQPEDLTMMNEAVKGMEARYRTLFGGEIGKEVLADIISALGLFEEIHTPQEQERHNVAIELLRWSGIIKKDDKFGRAANCNQLVNSISTERE